MKRLWAIIAGLLLFVSAICGFKVHMNHAIADKAAGVRNLRTYERYWSVDAQKNVIEDNTLVIFGSSELVSLSSMDDWISSFLNGDEMNIMTVGGGYFQSLSHTIELGALESSITSKKVALFLSPQWFYAEGIGVDEFPSRFSEDELLAFIDNPNISDDSKQYVLNRVVSLLQNSPTQQARVQKYQKAFNNKLSLESFYTWIMRSFWRYRAEFSVYRQLDDVVEELPTVDLANLDYDEILDKAEKQGEEHCTNNDFGIYDDYWDTYVKERYENGEVIEKQEIFTDSVEYEDLRQFLNVAGQLGIEVILVSIPVNGKWYAYEGKLCNVYYQNIRDIAAEYSNVSLVDMTQYENEPYFLKDIMHLGWKGWTRINEALYREFTEK